MVKTKAKRLLSLLLAFAMVLSLTVTPVYAADDDTASGSGTSETGETSSTSAGTFSEPEAVEAEAVAAVEDDEEEEELTVYEDPNAGIAMIDEDDSGTTDLFPAAVNGVITLTENVALTETYTVTSDVTIDLNGHSITRGSNNTGAALIKGTSGNTLTVQDSSSGASGYIDGSTYAVDGTTYIGYGIQVAGGTVNVNSGTVTGYRGISVSSGTLNVSGGTVSSTYSYGIYQSGGTVNVTNGSVSGTRGIAVYGGTATVSGGTVSGTDYGVYNYYSGVTVSGGTVSGTYGIYVSGGSVTVSGGTVSGTQRGISIGASSTDRKVTVSGGSVTGGYYGIVQLAGTLNVTGGTVTGANVAVIQYAGTVSVTGGTIGGSSCTRGMEVVAVNGDTTTTITGGTVSATDLGIYVSDYTSTSDDGTSTSYAATLTIGTSGDTSTTTPSVSGTDYGGIYATTGADVIVNSGSVTGESAILVWQGENSSNDTTLTVNGGSIVGTTFGVVNNGSTYYTSITVNDGSISGAYGMYLPAMDSTTTITGGTITGSTTGIEIRAGSLTVSGGTITSTSSEFDTSTNGSGTTVVGAGIAVSQHSTNKEVTVTITGGDISGYYGVYEMNTYENNTSKVTVTISGDDTTVTATSDDGEAVCSTTNNDYTSVTVSGGTYSTDVSSYVGTDYTTYTNADGTVTVIESNAEAVAAIGSTTYTSLSDAFNAVTDGQTIVLLGDVADSTTSSSDNGLWQVDGISVTLNLNNKTLTSNAKRMFGVLNAGSLTVKNGSVTSTYTGSDVTMIITRGGSTFAAEDVTFDATNHSYLVYAAGSDTVSLTTCTIKNVSNAVVKDNSTEATITLKGCTYTKTPIVGTNVKAYKIIINSNGGSITSSSGAPEIDSNGLVRLDFNYIVEDGGSIETTGTIYLRNDSGAASLTVDGGTVSAAAVEIRDTTTLTANGGTVNVTGAITVKDGGTVVISDTEEAEGETEVKSEVSAASITVNTGAAMTVSGGELTVSGSITVQAVSEDEDAPTNALTISGGTISVGQIYSLGSISMTGGTVTSSSSYDNGAIYAKSGSISISGGTVNVTGTRGVVIDDASGTISGGTFTATSIGLLTRGSSISITGGTYTAATGLYTKNTSVLGDYSVFNTEGNAVTATSSGEYKSTLEDKTVVVGSGVAEVNGTKYGTLQAAINAAGSSDTVKMLTSVAEDITVASGANVTLDLNGCTLTNVSSDTITVDLGATLTITGNGTVDNVTHAKAAIYNNGTVTLSGGTYTRSLENGQSSSDNGGNSFYVILNHGTMTINSGVTVSQDGHYSSMIENGYQSYNNSTNARGGYVEGTNAANPTLTINGGTFTGGLNTVKNDDGATLEINGGTFTNTTQATVMNWNVATINKGTFVSSAYVILNGLGSSAEFDQGVLTIKDGSFTAGDGYTVIGITSSAKGNGTITITGGSYSDNSADTYLTGTSYQVAHNEEKDGTAEAYKVVQCIYGKSINLSEGKIILNVYVTDNDVANVDSITGSLDDESDATRTTKEAVTGNEKYAYVLSQKVYANMMAKTLTVTVTLSDGYVVTYKTSVREYCVDVIDSGSTSDEQKAAAKAMLNYGAAAQNYSGYDTDNLANKDYEYETGATELKDASTMYSNGAKLTTKTDSDYNGVKLSTMNVVFDYDFTVKLTFNGELTGSNLTSVSLNGKVLEQDEDYTVSGKVITITGLSAAQMAQKISIVTKDDAGLTKTSNLPGLYYAYLSAQSTNEAKQLLGQTLYAYCNAVVALNSTSTNATNE